MDASDIVVCTICTALAVTALITLKLALKRKQQQTHLLSSSRQCKEVTCNDLVKFLLARFTLVEVVAVRAAHYKLNWLFALAVFTLTASVQPAWQYFAWSVGTLLGMAGFLALDMHIFRNQGSQAIDLDDRRALQWRRPLLYGSYALTTVLGFSITSYLFYYKSIPIVPFSVALGVMIAADQVARVLLLSLFAASMTKYQPMRELMTRYLEFQKQEEEIKVAEGFQAASPKRKKGPINQSPSRVPKANAQAEAESIVSQAKPTGPFELDSLVNFLELSQHKRIAKARLPPMHNYQGTPTNKLKQQSEAEIIECSKFNTPIRTIGRKQSNLLMSDVEKALDDRVLDRPDPFELNGVEMNSKCLQRKQASSREMDREYELKQLETINHKYGTKSKADTNRGEGSQVKTNRNIDSDYEEMNTVDIHTKVSRRRPMDSPRDIIPKCHNNQENLQDEETRRKMWVEPHSHKRSFNHIEEEAEEDDLPRKRGAGHFSIQEGNQEFQDEDAPTREIKALTLEPRSIDLRSARQDDPYGHKTSVLEIRQEGMDELEEVDLNSPVKRKSMSPQKIKQVGNPKHKKRTKKRDIRELMKYNSGSPYLEYLPNMLKGEIEVHNKKSLKQMPTREATAEMAAAGARRGRSTRRGTNPQPRLPLGIDANNQNVCPADDIVEDF